MIGLSIFDFVDKFRKKDKGMRYAQTLDLNETLLESVSGIIKYNYYIDRKKEKRAISNFEKRIRQNESGILTLDNKEEFQKINFDPKIFNSQAIGFIDEKQDDRIQKE